MGRNYINIEKVHPTLQLEPWKKRNYIQVPLRAQTRSRPPPSAKTDAEAPFTGQP
jgi:hypothetical protein